MINIKELQVSALSRINFCFMELQKNPPLMMDEEYANRIKQMINEGLDTVGPNIRIELGDVMHRYLKRESTIEARMMLIINYLAALLIKGKNNKISIYENYQDRIEEINTFMYKNKAIIDNIKTLRDKLYAHMDLDYLDYAKDLSFQDIKICIEFLNNLLCCNFNNLKNIFER